MPTLLEEFNRLLYRTEPLEGEPLFLPVTVEGSFISNNFAEVDPALLNTGKIVGNLNIAGGFLQSENFVAGTSGWQLTAEGNFEGSSGVFRGNLSVSNLTAGTITSQDIALAVSAGTGDVTIRAGKTDFTNTESGFILGIDDSDSDRAKFYIGDSTDFFYWNGVDLFLSGRKVSTLLAFGNGIDGDVTISSNTTLTADVFYDDLIINSSIVLTTAGYKVFVKGTLTNNGTIRFNGNNGTNGQDGTPGGAGGAGGSAISNGTLRGTVAGQTGGAGQSGTGLAGTAGTAENPSLGAAGAAGGDGGNSSGGGAAGAATTEVLLYQKQDNSDSLTAGSEDTTNVTLIYDTFIPAGQTSGTTCSTSAGSGSGGGGGGPSLVGGGGGGSGATGGCMFVAAEILTNNGTIEANGGAGGDGGDASDGGNSSGGGGGAGGSGGVLILFYETLTVGTITVTGGAGGTRGLLNGTGSNGNNGTVGVVGNIFRLHKQ